MIEATITTSIMIAVLAVGDPAVIAAVIRNLTVNILVIDSMISAGGWEDGYESGQRSRSRSPFRKSPGRRDGQSGKDDSNVPNSSGSRRSKLSRSGSKKRSFSSRRSRGSPRRSVANRQRDELGRFVSSKKE